jgi:hypothetical protein
LGGHTFVVAVALAAVTDVTATADDAADDAKLNAKQALVSARLVYMKDGSYQAVTATSLKRQRIRSSTSQRTASARARLS